MAPNPIDQPHHNQTRTYDRFSSIVFFKTREAFGGLSNMASGFPLRVNGIRIRTSEALYQACRFPHLADVQRLIIRQKSPMTAKMKSKVYRPQSRPDWNHVRVRIMRWCLRVKLAQNWNAFSKLLLQTGDRPIVEQSRRDAFWGALPKEEQLLVGMNVLGRLLMELREHLRAETQSTLLRVEPPPIHDFLLEGLPIERVTARELGRREEGVAPDIPPRHEDAPTYAAAERYEHLPPYPAYKDSGVPWLGEVPTHWEVCKLRSVLTKTTERNRPDLPLLSVVRERGVILRDVTDMNENHNFIPDDLTNYKVVHEGQFAMNKMKAWQGSYGVSRQEGIVSPAYFIFDIDGVTGDYFHVAVRSKAYVPFFTQASDGVRIGQWDLSQSRMREIPFLVPPLPEQTAIVRFLDHADRRIQRYIRAKQKLIALLEEQKQAIIHQAVTGQIDVRTGQPYPAYKPSGVEWLGEVPAHWGRRRLKTLLRSVDRRSTTGEETLLSLRRDHGVVIYAEHFTRPPQGRTLVGFKLVAVGQLVVNRMQANNGLVFCSGINGLVSPDYSVFEMREPLQMQYLSDLLRTSGYRAHFRREATGLGTGTAGFLRLYDEKLLETIVFLPPLEEQILILKSLAEGMARIKQLIEREQHELQLMGEYRTRLIADVVTGKLDVREAAAMLPEVDPLAAEDNPDDSLQAAALTPAHSEARSRFDS